MSKPAARLGDPVAHLPPVLTGGPCSPNVWIGSQPAWLGADPAQIAALMKTVEQAKEEIAKAGRERELVKGSVAEGKARENEAKTIEDANSNLKCIIV